MAPRWLFCGVVVLATHVAQAQTAPVPSEDTEARYAEEMEDDVEAVPLAPSAPPQLPSESPTSRPFQGAVWASGHWYWDGDEWRFNQGTWLSPMSGYQYVNGYWAQDPDGWRWVSGGWARPGTTEVEFAVAVSNEALSTEQAPPQLQAEVQPVAPSPSSTWAPGYWYWSGANWSWVGGMWLTPPRPNLVFVSPRWVRHGHRWDFVGGGWANHGSVRVTIPVYRHSGVSVRWGHPNYFAHSWGRYPVVRHYSYGHSHYGYNRYNRSHHGYNRSDYGYNRYNYGNGRSSDRRWREPSHPRSHPATPVGPSHHRRHHRD
ncbi:hypothetical protein P2318_11245 [Myxococcaceae bacterium GXIMD 01537]